MRAQLRPNAFLRMIENRFVSGEDRFVDPAWWDACIDSSLATIFREQGLPVWIGIDASVKHDTTAIVVVTWDRARNKVRLVAHKVFQPTPAAPLNFEWAIEGTVRDLRERFFVRGVYYDPYQMAAVAQRLAASGVPMREYAQTIEHLTAMGSNLYDLIKSRTIIAYPDDGMKLAMSRAVALETPRGSRSPRRRPRTRSMWWWRWRWRRSPVCGRASIRRRWWRRLSSARMEALSRWVWRRRLDRPGRAPRPARRS
jgi:phage terminase large subunit-like protein